jgi:hypothetical protein
MRVMVTMRCRLPREQTAAVPLVFRLGGVSYEHGLANVSVDAALPFTSMFAGLVIAADLVRSA